MIEDTWLSPRISAETMNLTGGLAFASALAGGALAGPVGAFLALPTAALISSFIARATRMMTGSPMSGEAPPVHRITQGGFRH